MFKLFKKQSEQVSETITKEYTSKYSKEVQDIHHAFETAADKLLEEAKSVIDQSSIFNLEKVKRLSALGFTRTNEVEKGQKIIKEVELSKEQIELINYFKKEYPKNKFITEEQVMEICHKYNLVCGDVDRFKGFVPEKNLQDIENFTLKSKEKNSMIIEAYSFSGNKVDKILYCENLEVRKKGEYWHIFSKKGLSDGHSFQQTKESLAEKGEFYGKDYENFFGLNPNEYYNIRIINNGFKICAPVKDMDISGLNLKNGYKLEKHIPDPIILKPVKGGYLVVTAWGDESHDPILK